jgi:hypothetical protein
MSDLQSAGVKRAASSSTGRSRTSIAAAEFGIEARVVTLTEEVIAKIKETQQRQDIRITNPHYA